MSGSTVIEILGYRASGGCLMLQVVKGGSWWVPSCLQRRKMKLRAGVTRFASGRGLRGRLPLCTPVRSSACLADAAVTRPFGQRRSRALRRFAVLLVALAMQFKSVAQLRRAGWGAKASRGRCGAVL